MKNRDGHLKAINLLLIISLLGMSIVARSQDTTRVSPPLPEEINKIVSALCMPCHSAKGGIMARSKLNFNEWTSYPAEKQKEKAITIYDEVLKDKMPPKNARESNPGIIPTKEQLGIIKKWVDSF